MSSPMMNMMLGFWSCAIALDGVRAVADARSVSAAPSENRVRLQLMDSSWSDRSSDVSMRPEIVRDAILGYRCGLARLHGPVLERKEVRFLQCGRPLFEVA